MIRTGVPAARVGCAIGPTLLLMGWLAASLLAALTMRFWMEQQRAIIAGSAEVVALPPLKISSWLVAAFMACTLPAIFLRQRKQDFGRIWLATITLPPMSSSLIAFMLSSSKWSSLDQRVELAQWMYVGLFALCALALLDCRYRTRSKFKREAEVSLSRGAGR